MDISRNNNKNKKQSITFRFKDCTPNSHLVLPEFHCGLSIDLIMLYVLDTFNLRIGEHTTIPPLSKKKAKPSGCGINNCLTFNALINQGKQKNFNRVERKPID